MAEQDGINNKTLAPIPSIQIRNPKDVKIEDIPDSPVDEVCKKETRRLQFMLKMYLYAAFKWKDGVCSFHLVYCLIFLIQITKIGLITTQMFDFGHDRANFSSIVNRGHLALRHLLLEGWDASWETLPYPPAHGDFAVYTIDDLVSGIDFAVSRYYNADQEAIGYYVRRPGDEMIVKLKHFDFPGFDDSSADSGVTIHDDIIKIDKGLVEVLNASSGEKRYNYSILKEFEFHNLSRPIKRLLSITLEFNIHSVRVVERERHARCLSIRGQVFFKDLDNNGQVNVDLETLTKRIKCADMNLSIPDSVLEYTSKGVGAAVITFCILSLAVTVLTVAFAIYLLGKTKRYMKKNYKTFYRPMKDDEHDLPTSEYFKFIKLWDFIVLLSDVLTLFGTIWIVFNIETSELVLETLDSYTVWLGIGCVLAWLSLLRFFKFHIKFNLLFSTLYGAFGNVMAYLLCVGILFLGFWVCGYVVMGPYHVKFQTPEAAMETLFAIVNGDEIFATMAILESDKSGGNWVFWFSRIYIGAYVAIFTIVVINLLIAIFMSSYEAIKAYYDDAPEERDLGPMEKAIRRFLVSNPGRNSLRSSLYELMTPGTERSAAETTLMRELAKLVRVSEERKDIVLMRSRTLKAFMEDDDGNKRLIDCRYFKCSFAMLSGRKMKTSN